MAKMVDKTKYKKRIMDDLLEKYLTIFGGICIEGPKGCGKSTTSSYHANSEISITYPNIEPSSILNGKTPRLISEWQESYGIWDTVRYEIDHRGEKGQFILTNSSIPSILNKRIHSGAGRIGRLRMRTMSLYESGDSSGLVSLKDLCEGKLETILTDEVNLMDLARYIVRGGFPGVISEQVENAQIIAKSYIETILHDDVKKIDDKEYDLEKMTLLLRSLARNESTTATMKKLASDIKTFDDENIDYDTVMAYLDVFERLFLLDYQKPFSTNIRSSLRVKQAEKRHFCDPSLTCALLNLTPDKLMEDLETFGFLFEALCERDLRIYAESFDAHLFHYQDYGNNEIDAVIELNGGRWCAIEIKLGANQIDKAATNLINIKNKIASKGGKTPTVMIVISGLANAAYQRPDGVYVVPITALKN